MVHQLRSKPCWHFHWKPNWASCFQLYMHVCCIANVTYLSGKINSHFCKGIEINMLKLELGDQRETCCFPSITVVERDQVLPWYVSIVLLNESSWSHKLNTSPHLTHRLRQLELQQLRAVFIKCGGSEKKNIDLPSSAYLFGTLYNKESALLCNFTKRLLTDAPSAVVASTYNNNWLTNQ